MDTIMEISLAHVQPPLLYSEQTTGTAGTFFSTLLVFLSRIANTCQPVTSKFLYKHYIL